ncbi:MAG TPA: isochorismatase family cysteine hydrolase [Geobacterales bacterium]|nr:isochorismatase family cysteine hydrolase [Geobacterales bacterium]
MSVEVPAIKLADNVVLESKSTALIIVDMQNDFSHPKGKLFVPKSIETIPVIKTLIEKARRKKVLVIFTQDWHMKNDPEFAIWGEHAIQNTWGAEIVEELKPLESDVIIRKLRYDAFYGSSLDHILRLNAIKNLVITGTVANICVLHTAGSAALRWYKVIVPVDAISALTDFDYYSALRQIDFLYKGILTKASNIDFV